MKLNLQKKKKNIKNNQVSKCEKIKNQSKNLSYTGKKNKRKKLKYTFTYVFWALQYENHIEKMILIFLHQTKRQKHRLLWFFPKCRFDNIYLCEIDSRRKQKWPENGAGDVTELIFAWTSIIPSFIILPLFIFFSPKNLQIFILKELCPAPSIKKWTKINTSEKLNEKIE